MNKIKAAILPAILATGIIAAAKPANANLLHDLAVGAGTNVVSGLVFHNGSLVGNAVDGAATGAAVGAAHGTPHSRTSGLIQDSAVGAATNTAAGAVTGNGHTGKNALSGAADGVLLNILR